MILNGEGISLFNGFDTGLACPGAGLGKTYVTLEKRAGNPKELRLWKKNRHHLL